MSGIEESGGVGLSLWTDRACGNLLTLALEANRYRAASFPCAQSVRWLQWSVTCSKRAEWRLNSRILDKPDPILDICWILYQKGDDCE